MADTEQHHPKGLSQAYADIATTLAQFDFRRVQGSLYVTNDENMARLFMAIQPLKSQPWFPPTVRDIRAFRLEQWSDFTPVVIRSAVMLIGYARVSTDDQNLDLQRQSGTQAPQAGIGAR